MPFLIKAVAMALKAHPTINASVDMPTNQIIYKDYMNIGIAVDSERGLVVPALRSVDKWAIPDIARELSELARKVREEISASRISGVAHLRSATWVRSAELIRHQSSTSPKQRFCWSVDSEKCHGCWRPSEGPVDDAPQPILRPSAD